MKAWAGASFPLGVLLAITALTLWLKHASEIPDDVPVDKGRHDPDTIIERFSASALDAKGRPLHRVTADRLVRFGDDAASELTRPTLQYTAQDRPAVLITALNGRIWPGKEAMSLSGNVSVMQIGSGNAPGWQAQMEEITAFPDERTARTASHVVLTQGSAVIEGDGFVLDQSARVVTLESRVKGRIPPRTPPSESPHATH